MQHKGQRSATVVRVRPQAHQAIAIAAEHHHPGPGQYILVASVLAAITACEVGVYYVHGLGGLMTAILLALSATKFALVALFYMHLKFDSRLFTFLFVGGLAVAASILLALLALFAYHTIM